MFTIVEIERTNMNHLFVVHQTQLTMTFSLSFQSDLVEQVWWWRSMNSNIFTYTHTHTHTQIIGNVYEWITRQKRDKRKKSSKTKTTVCRYLMLLRDEWLFINGGVEYSFCFIVVLSRMLSVEKRRRKTREVQWKKVGKSSKVIVLITSSLEMMSWKSKFNQHRYET
jgi:hypothetical protein